METIRLGRILIDAYEWAMTYGVVAHALRVEERPLGQTRALYVVATVRGEEYAEPLRAAETQAARKAAKNG
jgi:hypothetical protein